MVPKLSPTHAKLLRAAEYICGSIAWAVDGEAHTLTIVLNPEDTEMAEATVNVLQAAEYAGLKLVAGRWHKATRDEVNWWIGEVDPGYNDTVDAALPPLVACTFNVAPTLGGLRETASFDLRHIARDYNKQKHMGILQVRGETLHLIVPKHTGYTVENPPLKFRLKRWILSRAPIIQQAAQLNLPNELEALGPWTTGSAADTAAWNATSAFLLTDATWVRDWRLPRPTLGGLREAIQQLLT
jgi:hypothetical protein